MTLREFKQKLKEYETNNVTAFMGTIQITQIERDDLIKMYGSLADADKAKAAKLLQSKGVDVPK